VVDAEFIPAIAPQFDLMLHVSESLPFARSCPSFGGDSLEAAALRTSSRFFLGISLVLGILYELAHLSCSTFQGDTFGLRPGYFPPPVSCVIPGVVFKEEGSVKPSVT